MDIAVTVAKQAPCGTFVIHCRSICLKIQHIPLLFCNKHYLRGCCDGAIDECSRLPPPMWPDVGDSWSRRHMRVEFVVDSWESPTKELRF